MQRAKLFGSLVAVMMVLANILATKIFTVPIIGISVTAGVFPIAVMFLSTDILSERFGEAEAREWVRTALFILGLSWVLIYFAVVAPPAASWSGQKAFETTLMASFPIVIASFLTFAVSQHFDVWLFHRIRDRTGVQMKWLRNIGSTSLSQLVDTALFTILAFQILPNFVGGAILPLSVIGQIIIAEYAIKLTLAVVDTPAFYAFSHEQSA